MSEDHIVVFDTTLRDGEQSPGASMTVAEKVMVAEALATLGVDVIEAGFPAASPADAEAVARIASTVGAAPDGRLPAICALARTAKGDIDAAWRAIRDAEHPRLHTFLATSEIHLEHKLRLTEREVLSRVGEMVAYARSLCEDVEFSAEDAARTDIDFLQEVAAAAASAGASTINLPDTVGAALPEEYREMVVRVRAVLPDDVVVSVHCHDDLGLANANTLAGITGGARQVEVTINGIGERAGNAALEEVVMALETRRTFFDLETNVDTMRIAEVSRLVEACTSIPVPPNKPVVGSNAFAHEAGIHQDGVLKHAATYEAIRPEDVGAKGTLVLGKHSGRHAIAARLRMLGVTLDDRALDVVFARFKHLTAAKKEISDHELIGLLEHRVEARP